MFYEVELKISQVDVGITQETKIRLEVNQAPSGLYVAHNPADPSLIAASTAPQYAILAYLGDLSYRRFEEKETLI